MFKKTTTLTYTFESLEFNQTTEYYEQQILNAARRIPLLVYKNQITTGYENLRNNLILIPAEKFHVAMAIILKEKTLPNLIVEISIKEIIKAQSEFKKVIASLLKEKEYSEHVRNALINNLIDESSKLQNRFIKFLHKIIISTSDKALKDELFALFERIIFTKEALAQLKTLHLLSHHTPHLLSSNEQNINNNRSDADAKNEVQQPTPAPTLQEQTQKKKKKIRKQNATATRSTDLHESEKAPVEKLPMEDPKPKTVAKLPLEDQKQKAQEEHDARKTKTLIATIAIKSKNIKDELSELKNFAVGLQKEIEKIKLQKDTSTLPNDAWLNQKKNNAFNIQSSIENEKDIHVIKEKSQELASLINEVKVKQNEIDLFASNLKADLQKEIDALKEKGNEYLAGLSLLLHDIFTAHENLDQIEKDKGSNIKRISVDDLNSMLSKTGNFLTRSLQADISLSTIVNTVKYYTDLQKIIKDLEHIAIPKAITAKTTVLAYVNEAQLSQPEQPIQEVKKQPETASEQSFVSPKDSPAEDMVYSILSKNDINHLINLDRELTKEHKTQIVFSGSFVLACASLFYLNNNIIKFQDIDLNVSAKALSTAEQVTDLMNTIKKHGFNMIQNNRFYANFSLTSSAEDKNSQNIKMKYDLSIKKHNYRESNNSIPITQLKMFFSTSPADNQISICLNNNDEKQYLIIEDTGRLLENLFSRKRLELIPQLPDLNSTETSIFDRSYRIYTKLKDKGLNTGVNIQDLLCITNNTWAAKYFLYRINSGLEVHAEIVELIKRNNFHREDLTNLLSTYFLVFFGTVFLGKRDISFFRSNLELKRKCETVALFLQAFFGSLDVELLRDMDTKKLSALFRQISDQVYTAEKAGTIHLSQEALRQQFFPQTAVASSLRNSSSFKFSQGISTTTSTATATSTRSPTPRPS
jgi:hypothetical protein